jgi:hypothetical protein
VHEILETLETLGEAGDEALRAEAVGR